MGLDTWLCEGTVSADSMGLLAAAATLGHRYLDYGRWLCNCTRAALVMVHFGSLGVSSTTKVYMHTLKKLDGSL
jgi:hypothetical protein